MEEEKGTVEMAERLVELYESEGLDALTAKAYEIAAVEYKKLGELGKARGFSKKAVRMGKLWLGPGSEEFRRMVRLERDLKLELARRGVV